MEIPYGSMDCIHWDIAEVFKQSLDKFGISQTIRIIFEDLNCLITNLFPFCCHVIYPFKRQLLII